MSPIYKRKMYLNFLPRENAELRELYDGDTDDDEEYFLTDK